MRNGKDDQLNLVRSSFGLLVIFPDWLPALDCGVGDCIRVI